VQFYSAVLCTPERAVRSCKASFLIDFVGDCNDRCITSSTVSFVNTRGLPLRFVSWTLLVSQERSASLAAIVFMFIGEVECLLKLLELM